MSSDILIVDDEADIRDLVAGILEDEGYKTRVARNSDQAVAAVKGREFNGFLAWIMWMMVHVFYLNDLKNRALVISQWAFSYLTTMNVISRNEITAE